MKMQKVGIFLAGVIIGAFVFSSSLAQAWTGQLQVDFIPLNYFFNGVQKYPPSDQQGFIYNERTYVPLRFIAEASGLSVDWDGNTNSIYVSGSSNNNSSYNNQNYNNQSSSYMCDILEPFYNTPINELKTNHMVTLGGKTYYKSYYMRTWNFMDSATVSFNLGGQYSQISGLVGLEDSNNGIDTTLVVYGDNNVIKTYDLKAGNLPQNLDLNVEGINKLDFIIKTNADGIHAAGVALCDLIIE